LQYPKTTKKSPSIDSTMTTTDTPPSNADSVVPDSSAANQAPVVQSEVTSSEVPSPESSAKKLISGLKLDPAQLSKSFTPDPDGNSANLDPSFAADTPKASETSFISWHVHLKTDDGVIQLLLPTLSETSNDTGWSEIWEQIQQRLAGAKRFWQPLTPVYLYAQDRLLDTRQLQVIANALEEVQLSLQLVHTSRRQTAVAAATAGYSVQQHNPHNLATSREALAEPLYLQMTVRSGMEIRHPGTVVIIGDVNPGGEIIAAGDIIVWGNLKGIAHAGSRGNDQCLIMALQMFPTQIRIANFIARSPEQQPVNLEPEVAHVVDRAIRITPSIESKRIPALVDRSTQNKNRFF
jgi:septum site-determining protein MinC